MQNDHRDLRKEGAIALFIILLGNLAAFLDSIHKINTFLLSLFGIKWLGYALTIIVIIVLAGYVLGYWVLYKRYLDRYSGTKKIILASVLFTTVCGAFIANKIILRFEPDPAPLLEEVSVYFTKRIIAVQAPSGGMRIMPRDLSSEPQVWTTAQCLAVLLRGPYYQDHQEAIKQAFDFLEQSRQAGAEEGWGYWPNAKWTITEVAAWVTLAHLSSLSVRQLWNQTEKKEVIQRVIRDLRHLAGRQYQSGGWSPVKKVDVGAGPTPTRTYSTIMALWALIEAKNTTSVAQAIGDEHNTAIRNGVLWLLNNYDEKRGWIPNPRRTYQMEPYVALTAQTLYILAVAEKYVSFLPQNPRYRNAKQRFLLEESLFTRPVHLNERIPETDQHLRPLPFQIEGSTFLWYPWCIMEYLTLSKDPSLNEEGTEKAVKSLLRLTRKIDELKEYLETTETYTVAESLLAVYSLLRWIRSAA